MIFFFFIIIRYLFVNVKDRRVVICELILCFLVFRDIFVKVLFKYFEVKKKIKKRKKRNIFYVN